MLNGNLTGMLRLLAGIVRTPFQRNHRLNWLLIWVLMSSAAGVKFNLILRIRGVEFNQKTLVPQLIETVTSHNSFECTYILELTLQSR